MRVRITFSKTDSMRYTSHLDLHRTWERTFRRAKLPLAYTQGFKPHPKLNLASALPLGFTSSGEVLDVWFEDELQLDDIERKLNHALPPGLVIHKLDDVDLRLPSLQTQLIAAEYLVTLLQPSPELDARLNTMVAAEILPRERRGKSYDLRPLIYELQRVEDSKDGCQRIKMRLAAQEGATGRPEEVLQCAYIDSLSARVQRTHLVFIE
ncbi:MAG TPA: TIGR03936 family radical SAM-associated protein [Anaerolineales bacterium]|nr:TIGR03936 family radical SAM-associated protein [Anaerolineales bacterium]